VRGKQRDKPWFRRSLGEFGDREAGFSILNCFGVHRGPEKVFRDPDKAVKV